MSTLDALKATGGFRGSLAIAIEGYDKLLTDSSDTAGLLTAWAATPWTEALSGAEIAGEVIEEFVPWHDRFPGASLSVLVRPDQADTFASAVFGTRKGVETQLVGNLSAAPGPGGIPVRTTAKFASSGSIHIDTEHIQYTAVDSDSFDLATRGHFSPFNRLGSTDHRFAQNHRVFEDSEHHTTYAEVSSEPRVWIGRWVGIWVHRIAGTEWDLKEDAHLLYAGRIVGVHDTSEGTRLDLNHILSEAFEKRIFQNPVHGTIKEGLVLGTGDKITISELYSTPTWTRNEAEIPVVTTPANVRELEAKRYTVWELISAINDALSSLKISTSELDANWNIGVFTAENGGSRTVITAVLPGSASTYTSVSFQISFPRTIAQMLGFRIEAAGESRGVVETVSIVAKSFTDSTRPELAMTSPDTPKRVLGFQPSQFGGRSIVLNQEIGQWIDNTGLLPPGFVPTSVANKQNGIFRIGKNYVLVTRGAIGEYAARPSPELTRAFGGDFDESFYLNPPSISIDETGELEAQQVLMFRKPLEYILPRLLASVQGDGYNHSTYDDLAFGLGMAIPWELIGDAFVDDLKKISLFANWDLQLLIDRPKSLSEILGTDLVARTAFPLFHDETLRMANMRGPVVHSETVSLDHSNQMVPGFIDDSRSEFEFSDEAIVNTVKLNYGASQGRSFEHYSLVQSSASITAYGHRSVELDMSSAYAQWIGPVHTIKSMARMLAKEILPIFAKPLVLIRRGLAPNLFYQFHPGDIVTVTDQHVRNPATGLRGITDHPAMVKRMSLNLGMAESTLFSQVELMLWDADRTDIFAPSGLIDQDADSGGFTDGYNSGTNTIRLKAHEYSDALEEVDAAAFEVGDEIEIVRIHDESGGLTSSLVTYKRTITGIGTNDLTLDSPNLGLGGGETAWDGTKLHRVIFQQYATCTADQRSEHAFYAEESFTPGPTSPEDKDAAVYLRDVPNLVTTQPSTLLSEIVGSDSTLYYEDDAPISVATVNQLIRNVDNMLDYHTAINAPQLLPNGFSQEATFSFSAGNSDSTDGYFFAWMYPIYVGRGGMGGQILKLRVAPRVQETGGAGTHKLRCYVSPFAPSGDGVGLDPNIIRIREPYNYAEWDVTLGGAGVYAVQSAMDIEIQHVKDNDGVVFLCWGAIRQSGAGFLEIAGTPECRVLPLEI